MNAEYDRTLLNKHSGAGRLQTASSGRLTLFYLCCGLIAARVVASLVLPVYDDAFISLRYARNLAEGIGFVYNANERVLGETCPLFGLLEAGMVVLHLPMPVTVLVMNILCDVALLWLTVRILQQAGYGSAIVVFALGFAFNPIMARICVGCMEMDIFLLCSFASIYSYHRDRPFTAIILASVAYFFRPEAVLLVGLLCVLELTRKQYARALRMALISMFIVAGPLYWIWSYYGSIIAQSVSAKARAEHTPYFLILHELIFNDPLQVLLFILALWGVKCIWKRDGILRTIALWITLYVIAYLGYRAFVYSWYGEPIHYGILMLAAIAIQDLVRRVSDISILVRPSTITVTAFMMIAFSVIAYAVVGKSKITKGVYEPLEDWCEKHPTPGATILAGDIGVIGFYSRDYIYDPVGLVWREANKYRSDKERIESVRPDYLFLNAARSTEELMKDSTIGNKYAPVARFPNGPLKLDSLPDKWIQEYILFARK